MGNSRGEGAFTVSFGTSRCLCYALFIASIDVVPKCHDTKALSKPRKTSCVLWRDVIMDKCRGFLPILFLLNLK